MAISSTGQVVAASQTRQTGAQPPTEAFCYTNTTGVAQVFALFVQGIRVASAPGWTSSSGTSTRPSSTRRSTRASATRARPRAPSRSARSAGRTTRSSPTAAAARRSTAGRSRTSPARTAVVRDLRRVHRLRAVGLHRHVGLDADGRRGRRDREQQNPTFGANEIQAFLETNGLDLGTPGKDNAYGSGALRIPTPSTTGPGRGDRTPPKAKALASKGVLGKTVKLYSQDSDETGEVRLVESIRRGTAVLKTLLTGYAKVKAGATYYVNWTAPRFVAPGRYGTACRPLTEQATRARSAARR